MSDADRDYAAEMRALIDRDVNPADGPYEARVAASKIVAKLDYYEMGTDPPPSTAAERDAMVRLAERWETRADNLADSIAGGASRHPIQVATLRLCAAELRQAMGVGRPGAQSGSADS